MKKEEVMGVEESLKTTADALKKQLKDEAHARTVLQVSQADIALHGDTNHINYFYFKPQSREDAVVQFFPGIRLVASHACFYFFVCLFCLVLRAAPN